MITFLGGSECAKMTIFKQLKFIFCYIMHVIKICFLMENNKLKHLAFFIFYFFKMQTHAWNDQSKPLKKVSFCFFFFPVKW